VSKSSRLRKRAKRRRFERSAAGRRKKIRQIINHLRYCPDDDDWWWDSNEPNWAPQITCQICHLKYTPDLAADEITVPDFGRFPANPNVLDLMVLGG
jgi:hypothetical protein